MTNKKLYLMNALFLLGFGAVMVSAQTGPFSGPPPQVIPYTGYLERDGVPANETLAMSFTLYTAETGGSVLFSETYGSPGVVVANGQFSVALGSTAPAGLADIWSNSEVWLQITVDGTTMNGRQRLLAAPYALRAADARRSGGDFSVTGALTGTGDFRTGGGVSVGNSSLDAPTGDLVVTSGIRVGNHTITDPANGDLVVAGKGDIVSGLRIGTHMTTNPTGGDLVVAGDVDIDGTLNVGSTTALAGSLSVVGGATFLGSVNLPNSALAVTTTYPVADGTTPTVQLASSTASICFLTQMTTNDNVGSAENDSCTVTRGASTWALTRGATDNQTICRAACLTW
ncbi:MAG: hypothetical protein IPG17_03295 [Sandaracinaceae bacterium]|nr:hypothetical protein [Sandaracinaceae bacterium]MBK8593797.1 hypothetical protein [Sandaracinaceae bacterium]